jgi:hypothetical protein
MRAAVTKLGALWRGEMPLQIAFWHYAIFCGLLINIGATVAAVVLIILDFPIATAVAVHLLPLPYTVLAMTGVWRSADRHQDRKLATYARVGALAWFVFWLAF